MYFDSYEFMATIIYISKAKLLSEGRLKMSWKR